MFKRITIGWKDYTLKQYLFVGLFFLVSSLMAITLANMVFFYNIHQTTSNFFDLVFMDRHPLSYFAYGTLAWYVLCYIFSGLYKGLPTYLSRLALFFGYCIYAIFSLVFFFYYLSKYNISFQTYTYLDAIIETVKDNLAYVFVNMGLAIFFVIEYFRFSNKSDNKVLDKSDSFFSDRSIFAWVVIACSAIAIILLLNEATYAMAAYIAGMKYQIFPHSIEAEIDLIQSGKAMSLVFALLMTVSAIILMTSWKIKGIFSKILLLVPITVLMGSYISSFVYFVFMRTSISASPLSFFQVYFSGIENRSNFEISAGIGFGIAFIFAIICVRSGLISRKKVHGNARLANYFDMLKYKMFKKRPESLFIASWSGMPIYSNGHEHVLILAPTGTGKSSTYGVINIMEWQGSSVHNDMSLELYNITSKYCRDVKGNEVYLFAPRQRRTMRWNIFHDACTLDKAERFGDLIRIAALIIPDAGNKDDNVWVKAARSGIECVSAYLISTTGYCTLGDVAEICCKGDFDEWLEAELENPETDEQFRVRANAYLSVKAQETRSGVKFNMDAYMGLYLDPIVRAATNKSDFSLKDLRRKKMDIFFGIPLGQIDVLSPLVTMFWEELTHQMTLNEPKDDEPYSVFCNIDETGNMGRINKLRTGSTFFRKYKLRVTYYFQYKDQSGNLYSDKEMKAFLNTKTKIMFTPSDDDDIAYISKLSGSKTVKVKTNSSQGWGVNSTTNEQYIEKPVLENNDIQYLPEEQMYVQIDGKYTIKANKVYYFLDKKYKFIKNYKVDYETDPNLTEQEPIFPEVSRTSGESLNPDSIAAINRAAKEKRAQKKAEENAKIEDSNNDE
jgi:type IV secretion system protein VirD4|tara:strand:- start:24097 stop:26619 length:2523 start_codon:yes stop_codon:yes gene_type:complete